MPVPLHRVKKKELFDALVQYGVKAEELAGKKRPELLKMVKECLKGEQANVALEDVKELVPSELQKGTDEVPEIPSQNDPEWTQYVLGQFLDDEVDGENPRVEGLRRVADKLIGPIVEEGCDLIDPPNTNNDMRACVRAWVLFSNGVRFEALADASPYNVSGDFVNYLVAMADTRAKGRCYRNALKLKRVVSAEEVGAVALTQESTKAIHTGQITAIRQLCNRNEINVYKLLDLMQIDHDGDLRSIDSGQALEILQKLHEMERNKNIPNNIKEHNNDEVAPVLQSTKG